MDPFKREYEREKNKTKCHILYPTHQFALIRDVHLINLYVAFISLASTGMNNSRHRTAIIFFHVMVKNNSNLVTN